MNWQSSSANRPTRSRATSHAKATFDASLSRLNIDFAEKGATKSDAVEAADQMPLAPALDRMGMARGMKPQRRPLDIGVDPGLVALGAAIQDVLECQVARNGEAFAADGARQRP